MCCSRIRSELNVAHQLLRKVIATMTLMFAGAGGLERLDEAELDGLCGRSTAMRKLRAEIRRVARSEASVLLVGETGSGKDLAAHAIHAGGLRAQGPFETVDCGALAPALVASELFGHEKGAFSGAEELRIGAFERASGGTLFLDEVGELPAGMQAGLLGALERRCFRRVGGEQPIRVDVRVVSATHRDLRAEINDGRFREDLYFRLAVVQVRVPPLRDRTDDIPILIGHFLRQAGYSGGIGDLIPASVLGFLGCHRWPGNVRELRNLVHAALAIGDMPDFEPDAGLSFASQPLEEILQKSFKEARLQILSDFEAVYVRALLARCRGNVSTAARLSKMSRSYLCEVIRRRRLRG